jgi:hypothetical protein
MLAKFIEGLFCGHGNKLSPVASDRQNDGSLTSGSYPSCSHDGPKLRFQSGPLLYGVDD